MTVIVDARLHAITVPLVRPFVTARRSATEHVAVLVELVDDEGRSGWGEAPCSWRVTGESQESVAAAVRGPLLDIARGRQPGSIDLRGAIVGNAAASAAVEAAAFDLAAQADGVPLAAHLGAATDAVRTDMTLSVGGADDMVALAVAHVAAGFQALKIKCGGAGDDRIAVREVRAAVGDGVELRVDANQAWTVEEAIEIIRAWERDGLGIRFVEQPTPARAFDQLAEVRRAVGTPVLADESVRDRDDLRELLRLDAVDMINIKLAKAGGMHEALALAALAADHGIGVLIGSMMESMVGIGAAASLAALVAPDAVHDLDAALWLSAAPVSGGAVAVGDVIRLAGAPGLGIGGAR